MFLAGAKGIDFCLISGIFFNFYCVTAHVNGGQPPSVTSFSPQNPSLYHRDGFAQTDVLKVSNGPSYGQFSHRYSAYPSSGVPGYSSSHPSSHNNYYGYSEQRPVASSFHNQRLTNLYWPFHHRDSSFYKPFSNPSATPVSSLPSSPSSYHHYSGYPSHPGSNTPSSSSNAAYANYGPGSGSAYGHQYASYSHPDPNRNDWYGGSVRYPNYSFYPHTAEYLTSNYASTANYYVGKKMVKAIAELRSSEKVTGTVTFEQADENVVVIKGRILGLSPGPHGLHILENKRFKDCSVGEHYNPTNTAHGGKHDWIRHVGDLGNIFADRDGVAYFDMTDQVVSLVGSNSIMNRTVVITEKADDLGRLPDPESKRSGNSGKPVACGTIELSRY